MKTATVKDLIDLARAQLGVKECPANSNKVKYNTWYYGRDVSGAAYPWCMVFVQWCCAQVGVELPTRTASCTALMNAAKKAGMWVTSDYRPGDISIYDWGGDKVPDHCGIITQETPGGYLCIEGNTAVGNDSNGGEVMERIRPVKSILGAVRPVYVAVLPEAVQWAVDNGIMQGNTSGDLMLDNALTRRQFVTMLHRYAKVDGKA
ncbi:MAG: CHAP domain-containing protein [Oscillibacter ruminantium]|uniref:CHAP domain-containing protein n=1 Tax=Oscillibacter ruminantium TaxID=1263547 RepID=UPI002B1F0F84|nr:CHAP domain-containing protein [Oscillibacter ruminantium]MEA5042664.1 CHAP domain-containing protein [Oscillibacter ruminantium]